jgi:hypothetical protein
MADKQAKVPVIEEDDEFEEFEHEEWKDEEDADDAKQWEDDWDDEAPIYLCTAMDQAHHPWASRTSDGDVDPGQTIELEHLTAQEVEMLFKVLQLNPQMAQSSGSGLSQLRDLLGRQEYQRRLQQLRKELIETQYQTRHQPYVTTPDPEAQGQAPLGLAHLLQQQHPPFQFAEFQPDGYTDQPRFHQQQGQPAPRPKPRANGAAGPTSMGQPKRGAMPQQYFGGQAMALPPTPSYPPQSFNNPSAPNLTPQQAASLPAAPAFASHPHSHPSPYFVDPEAPQWATPPGHPFQAQALAMAHAFPGVQVGGHAHNVQAQQYPNMHPYGQPQFALSGFPPGPPPSGTLPKDGKFNVPMANPSGYAPVPKVDGSPQIEYYSSLDQSAPLSAEFGADYGNLAAFGMYPGGLPALEGGLENQQPDAMYGLQSRLASKALGVPTNTQTFKLLKALQTASTQAQVVELAAQLPPEQLDVVSICTIMNRLAKVSHNKCPPAQVNMLVSRLLKRALTMVDLFEHQHASNILHAVAKLGIKDTRFVSVMKERVMHPSVVNELNPQDIANTVWALATLRTTNNKLIEVLTQRAMVPAVLNQFNSQHVTNIAWAMAKLGIVNTTLLNALADRAMCPEVLNNFNAQGVANTIWACAKSGFVHLKLMNALAERAMHPEVMNKFISQNLANIAWGWAKLALLDERLMHALATRAVEPLVLANFNTQEVANMSWAFARLGVLNEPLLLALAERAMHPAVLNKYTSQDLGNTSWAFAKLGVLHEPLMDALAERSMVPDVSATFNTQNVANVAWAFARLGIRNVPLLSMLAQRSLCRPVMYRFKPHQIGNTAWSFAKLGILNKPLMDALAKRTMDPAVLAAFQAQDIANVLWAFATLELMTPALQQRMEDRALDPQVLGSFSQQDIATTVMAYTKMGVQTADLLEALGRRALEAGILQESPQNHDDW